MKAIFPAWAAALRDPEIESQARQEWLRGLIENGINSDIQINAGLSKCRAHDSPFLPSIGQFVAWCRISAPTMQGVPTESKARLALTREIGKRSDIRKWNAYHPIVYWVYGQRESFDWKRMSTKELDTNFHELWIIGLSMAKQGHVFLSYTPPSGQIGEVPLPPAPKEVATKACSSLLSMLDAQAKPEPQTHQSEAARNALEIAKQRLAKGEI